MTEETRFIMRLKTMPLTAQEKRTLRGLAISGDMTAALGGLQTALRRNHLPRIKREAEK